MCKACETGGNKALEKVADGPAHLWDMPRSLRCPVAGACLTLDEIRKTFRKTGIPVKGVRPYELHGTAVEFLGTENQVSRRLDRIVKRRYRDALPKLSGLDENALAKAWEKGLKSGEMEGILLGIALRRDLSGEFVDRIFGEVHMLGHTASATVMRARGDLASGRELSDRMRLELRQEKKRRRELERENLNLRGRLSGPPAARQKDEGEMASDAGEVDRLREEIRIQGEALSLLSSENGHLVEQAASLARERDRLAAETRDTQRENGILLQEITGMASHIAALAQTFSAAGEGCEGEACSAKEGSCEGESCPRFDLCAKRVLIVGGITKFRHLYRDLVESGGGVFDYHDGYMTSGKQNLEARVKRSDLVICPVNCNSHGACIKVKRFCRKHNKAINMLPSASISAISSALYTAGTGSIN